MERAPVTHWIGGWVGPRAVLDVAVKRKITSPRRESKPSTPIVQPIAQSPPRDTPSNLNARRNVVPDVPGTVFLLFGFPPPYPVVQG